MPPQGHFGRSLKVFENQGAGTPKLKAQELRPYPIQVGARFPCPAKTRALLKPPQNHAAGAIFRTPFQPPCNRWLDSGIIRGGRGVAQYG
jgi:hypothetical protein